MSTGAGGNGLERDLRRVLLRDRWSSDESGKHDDESEVLHGILLNSDKWYSG